MRAIRFDPGYLYSKGADLASDAGQERQIQSLIAGWKRNRFNRVYVLLNNPVYGAFFRTTLPFQGREPSLGRTGFLARLMTESARAGIEPWAWFYVLRSKPAWSARATWRSPCDSEAHSEYLLSPAGAPARAWFSALVREALKRLPMVRGVDLAEPVARLGCSGAPSNRRESYLLTRFLRALALEIRQKGRGVTLTPTIPAHRDGSLWSDSEMESSFGFSLQEILAHVRMDAFYPQLIFQQWRAEYPGSGVFTPEWTAAAARAILDRVAGHARTGVHVELESFVNEGPETLSDDEISRLVSSLEAPELASRLDGIDFYESHLAAQIKAIP